MKLLFYDIILYTTQYHHLLKKLDWAKLENTY